VLEDVSDGSLYDKFLEDLGPGTYKQNTLFSLSTGKSIILASPPPRPSLSPLRLSDLQMESTLLAKGAIQFGQFLALFSTFRLGLPLAADFAHSDMLVQVEEQSWIPLALGDHSSQTTSSSSVGQEETTFPKFRYLFTSGAGRVSRAFLDRFGLFALFTAFSHASFRHEGLRRWR